MAKVLGIDVGERKIGLAIGDTQTRLAFPRPPLLVKTWDEAWPVLADIVAIEGVETVIVGWPVNDDGSTGPQAQQVQLFLDTLTTKIYAPIVKRDERFSTQAVTREQTAVGRQLDRGQEDSLVAQVLLEGYLAEHP